MFPSPSIHGLPHVLLLHLHVALGLQSHPEPDKPHRPPRNAMVDYYSSETLDLSYRLIEYIDLYLSNMMHLLMFVCLGDFLILQKRDQK